MAVNIVSKKYEQTYVYEDTETGCQNFIDVLITCKLYFHKSPSISATSQTRVIFPC